MKGYKFVKYPDIEFISITNEAIQFKEHCHSDCFVVTIVIDGNIILTKEDKSLYLSTGDCFNIVPYENHSVKSENNTSILSVV